MYLKHIMLQVYQDKVCYLLNIGDFQADYLSLRLTKRLLKMFIDCIHSKSNDYNDDLVTSLKTADVFTFRKCNCTPTR